jgi:hypothetical protein
VRFTSLKTGEIHTYTDPDSTLSEETLNLTEPKVMDCMDCHNRPSHNYLPPQNFIDDALTSGIIPKELPDAKMIAMQVLNQDYPSKDSALTAIRSQVIEYFKSMYPEIAESKKEMIEKTIAAIGEGFGRNIFPAMKVNWSAYPLHLGHLENKGCYRCHNDKHKSKEGRLISRDCRLCHNILAQGKPGEMEFSPSMESLEFKHLVEINEAWKTILCSECHFQLY